MVKFGFYTDTHLTNVKVKTRLDDYVTSMLSKIRFCYNKFEESGCEFVVHGGDMFDTHKVYSQDLLLKLFCFFMTAKLPTYIIMGQHDLYGYNQKSYPDSTLYFLTQLCGDKIRMIYDKVERENCVLVASHVDQDVVRVIDDVERSSKPVVVIAHCLLTDRPKVYKTVPTDIIGKSKVDLVLSGDLHCGFPYHEKNGVGFYNPGALARTSTACRDRKPACGIITIEDFFNKHSVNVEHVEVACHGGNDVFVKEEEIDISDVKVNESLINADCLIEGFNELKRESVDIFTLLELAGKKKNIDVSILEYIKCFKDRLGTK